MDELDEFEGGEEVDYDFNLDDDLLNEGQAPTLATSRGSQTFRPHCQ